MVAGWQDGRNGEVRQVRNCVGSKNIVPLFHQKMRIGLIAIKDEKSCN